MRRFLFQLKIPGLGGDLSPNNKVTVSAAFRRPCIAQDTKKLCRSPVRRTLRVRLAARLFRSCESIHKNVDSIIFARSYLTVLCPEAVLRASWKVEFFGTGFLSNTFTAPSEPRSPGRFHNPARFNEFWQRATLDFFLCGPE